MTTQKSDTMCNDTRILDSHVDDVEQHSQIDHRHQECAEQTHHSRRYVRASTESFQRHLDESQDHEQQQQQQKQQQQQQQQPQEPSTNVNVNNASSHNITAELNAIFENAFSDRVSLKLPEFADENLTNPLEFLDEVERYFWIKRVRENNKLRVISSLLYGKARYWFEMQTEFRTYQSFQAAFIQRFHPMPVQLRQKNKWANARFDPKIDKYLQSYYFSQLRKSNFLRPVMTNYEKNYLIIQQLPKSARLSLATVNCNDNDLINQALLNLDTLFSDTADTNVDDSSQYLSSASSIQEFEIDQTRANASNSNRRRCKKYVNRNRWLNNHFGYSRRNHRSDRGNPHCSQTFHNSVYLTIPENLTIPNPYYFSNYANDTAT